MVADVLVQALVLYIFQLFDQVVSLSAVFWILRAVAVFKLSLYCCCGRAPKLSTLGNTRHMQLHSDKIHSIR